MNGSQVDVVVLGLGAYGSAASASLARRGHRVVGIERFGAVHERGSSHGRTRMIRRAYPNVVWNDLVEEAYRAWAALELESGRTLVRRTGGIYAHVEPSSLQGPGCEPLSGPDEVAELMPGLRIPDGHRAVYDPQAGVIEAAGAIDALRESAVAHGAELRFGERVLGWDATASGVEVRTDRGVVRADRLVVAAGPFAGELVSRLAPFLDVWRILTVTVAPGQPVAMPPSIGAFSVDRPEGLVFGIPDVAGNGLKLGVDLGESWDPERPVAPATADEIAQLTELVARYVPGVDATPHEVAACLYTMTDDKRFTVGALSTAPEVIVVSACSGHGFKFAAALGDAVADLHEGEAREDLAFISTARRGI
jgi:monomeric sarcosine oxidase